MERKKPDKLNFALPLNNPDYFDNPPPPTHSNHPTNLNESLFFKYASSIFQVVAEDRLDNSCAGTNSQHPRNAIFQISEVKEFQGGGGSGGGSSCREQNNYNNMAAKMKKKAPNRKALAYNFSNITLFSQKIHLVFQKPLKNALETLKTLTINSDYNKTKKEIKRASFYSGYTTSTSNEEKTSKRNSKRVTEERKREMHEEGANSIKGWLQFKILLFLSHTYCSIKEFALKRTIQTPLGISQASTIKREPLQNFYLTEYNHDNSISIAREFPHNMSSSLVYTADHNFQFTQKEVTLTTPDKFGSEDRLSTPPLPNHMRKINSNQESFVESYKPKQVFSPQAKQTVSKEIVMLRASKPLRLAENQQRRYLTIRTNIYELPMLADHQLRADRQRVIKDPTILRDGFARSEPETCENIESIMNELKEADNLFKSKTKNIQIISQEKVEHKVNERKNYGSKVTQQKRGDAQVKKVASSNTHQVLREEKKDTQKLENYYYFNDNASPKTSKAIISSPAPHQQKNHFQQIKSVQSVLKVPSKPDKKVEKAVRIQESLVNEFTLDNRGKEQLHLLSVKSQGNTQGFGYQAQATERREERAKSRSKISIVMQQPQRKESPRVNLYHPNEPVHVETKPSIKVGDRHLNNPYGYPTSNEKPKSPLFTYHQQNVQSPRLLSPNSNMIPPNNNPQPIYQMSPKQVPSTPQRLISQVRSNEQLRTQQQMPRAEPIVRNSPGKVVDPSYLLNCQERRTIGIPSQLRHDEKKSFYSPQMPKDAYFLSPEKSNNRLQQTPKMQTPNNNVRRMCEPQYFTKEASPATQLKAVNFNNNYYTSGPQSARQPPIIEPHRNVFQQEDPPRRQTYLQRPPSSRQSCERGALFSNYSPLESELQHQQRSNHFSKNSSELSRPKSMNEKIFITLRKDK